MLEISLEANKKKNNENDDEISAVIYETLGEVELEYRKYGEALNYLVKALDLRKKFSNNNDKYALKRISFFINFIYDQYNYEEVHFGNTAGNSRLFETDRHKERLSSLNQNILLGNNASYKNNNIQVSNNFDNPSLLLSNSNLSNNNLLQQQEKTNTLLINTNKNNHFNDNDKEKDLLTKKKKIK